MKTLNRISDLEQYGLAYLTGEACALSQRLLFDLNEDGVALMAEYFGIPSYPLLRNRNPKRGVYWDVFDRDGYIEIERIDCPDAGDPFESDDEAVAFVMHRAVHHACPEARAAIRAIISAWDGDDAPAPHTATMTPTESFAPNWNSSVNYKPAVASILLPRNPEFYQELFKFLLFREGFEVVKSYGGVVTGMSVSECAEFPTIEGMDTYHNPRIPNQPRVGTRNVHGMSGRSE